jgi:hypothetical protein
MTCNVGKGDKFFRIIVGLAIGAVGIYFQNWLGLIGIVPLLTGIINFCPLYTLFKINTGYKSAESPK